MARDSQNGYPQNNAVPDPEVSGFVKKFIDPATGRHKTPYEVAEEEERALE